MEPMRIGDVGRRAGLTPKTIRYYEEIGLIAEPDRTSSGYRDYADNAVERLTFIRDAQASGLSLTEIGSILDMRDRGEQTCGHVIELLDHHLASIDHHITQLRTTRELMAEMSARAKALDPSDCLDAGRCQTITPDAAGQPAAPIAKARLHRAPSAHHRHP